MAAGSSNYPNGFPQGVTIKGVPLTLTNPGRVFWLGNATTLQPGDRGGSDGNKGVYNSPFSTLNYAITQCVANRGDIIVVKPGHSEAITTATAMTLAIAGVAIIGLGNGSMRPLFTISTANTATINVTADNISFTNCQFVGNFLSIAACFVLTTAKNFTLQSCTFKDTSSVLNFLNIVKSTGAANTVDGLTVLDCSWNGLGTTSVNSFILSANDVDACNLQRNNIKLARTATAAILMTMTAGALTNMQCVDNVVISQQTAETGGGMISVAGTACTGVIKNNCQGTLTTSTDIIVTTTVGFEFFNNLKTGVITASGFVLPAIDS